MNSRYLFALGAALTSAMPLHAAETPQPVQQQPAEPAAPLRVEVRGLRGSAASALRIKRDSLDLVDAVVADDIAKLPDASVADAVQRVPGVQIARDRGEGAGVAVRGLIQVETLLDGREIFTAGTGRSLDIADLPAEMLAGIDIYKSASAAQIEGGLGGVIDLRTRRPFDFAGDAGLVSARLLHGDLAKAARPQFALLASTRGRAPGIGELGLLVHLSHQVRAFREDQKGTGNPTPRSDLVPGRTLLVPNGSSETLSFGERRRSAASLSLQWRPSTVLDLHAEASLAEFHTRQDSHQVNVSTAASFVPGTVATFPGTDDLMAITWLQAPVSLLSFARDTIDRTRQVALGGRWNARPTLAVDVDLSHTRAHNNLTFSGPFMAGTAASFSHDLSTPVPGTQVAGAGLLDPASLRVTGVAYRTRPFDGSLSAFRLDATRSIDGSFWQALSAGVRTARRHATNEPGLIFADASVSGLSAADIGPLVRPSPYGFMPGLGVPGLGEHLIGDLGLARDGAALRAAYGITAPLPTAGNPLGVWAIAETTRAAYVSGSFKSAAWPLDGKLGLRVVQTLGSVAGDESVPSTGGVVPVHIRTRDTDWLPSLSVRLRPDSIWTLRAAASKTITRPNFDQLSPSLTLVANPIDPTRNQGGAGNPALRAIRSSNLDLAAEAYLSPTSAAHASLFWKKVDGFVTTVSSPEVHDGATYQVSRPRNADKADIQGVEIGVQHFIDSAAGALRGLGFQANYTYIDSRMPSGPLGREVPLQNLSRHSANVVGMVERGRFAARMAYNWRDRFLSGVTQVVGVGALPVYTAGYAWVDASLHWRLDEQLSVALEGSNLLRTVRRATFDVATRPQGAWLNDRQLGASLRWRFR